MKTQLFFVLCLALLFTACEKDADFATADLMSADDMLHQHSSIVPVSDGDASSSLTSDYCIDVSSTHALVGFGKFLPFRQSAVKDKYASKVEVGMYTIEASGWGTSAELARSTSEAKLSFNSRTNRLTGIIITKFFNGEELEQHIDSDAKVSVDKQAMIIKANVKRANLSTGKESLEQVRGELEIALPLNPKGWFEANLYCTGRYCTPVIK